MSTKTLEPYLAEHTFFKDLPKDTIQLLVSCAKNVRFDAGEVIFRQGEPADQFYLIRHGKIALEFPSSHRGNIRFETIGEHNVFGWSWLFPPYRWHYDARAVDLTRALSMDGKCLRDKCEKDPVLGYDLMKRFSTVIQDRLHATRLQLQDVYARPEKR
jgi:CRP-like cAMP-binding protein